MKTWSIPGIRSVRFYKYRLKLSKPLRLKSGIFESRGGILVHIQTDTRDGWGDIAPLSGYTSDQFEDVEAAVRLIMHHPEALAEKVALYPALQCGWQYAMEPPVPISTEKLTVAKLINSTGCEQLLEELHASIQSGYSMVKIKVGAQSIKADIAMIQQALEITPTGVKLRLDANRSWSLNDAVAFARSVENDRIDFIEEPLNHFEEYSRYARAQNVPFALDESLTKLKTAAFTPWQNMRCVVLKPVLLGGPSIARQWISWAESHGLDFVISSVFESGVGIRSLLALASSYNQVQPIGIDTYSYLADDIVTPKLIFKDGAVDMDQLSRGSWKVDVDKLEEII